MRVSTFSYGVFKMGPCHLDKSSYNIEKRELRKEQGEGNCRQIGDEMIKRNTEAVYAKIR